MPFSLPPARAVLRLLAALALALLLSPHWLALPPSQSPTLSAAQRPLALMAEVSAQLRLAGVKTTAKHATPGRLRPRRQQVNPFPRSRGTTAPSARSAQGRLSHFIKQKTYKRFLCTCPR